MQAVEWRDSTLIPKSEGFGKQPSYFPDEIAMMATASSTAAILPMRRLLLTLTLAVALLVRVPLTRRTRRCVASSTRKTSVLRSLGGYFESLRLQAGIPGLAASIIGPDEVIWEQAFGRQDNERFIATRADTPFHLDG
jgi:hypothetical protein